MNMDRKRIKGKKLFVSLQSKYFAAQRSEYFVKAPNFAKLAILKPFKMSIYYHNILFHSCLIQNAFESSRLLEK
jgi:hypothetical protein